MHSPISINNSVIPRDIYTEYNLRLLVANRNKLFWGLAAGMWSVLLALNISDYLLRNQSFPFTIGALAVFFAFVYFGTPIRWRSHFGKVYDKTPAISAPANFVLTPTQLEASTVFNRGETSWSTLIGAVEHQDWLMLHLNNRTFFAINTLHIAPPATLGDLYALLGQHNIPLGLAKVAKVLGVAK